MQKKTDPSSVNSDTTAFFFKWHVPQDTELTTIVAGKVIVEPPSVGPYDAFQTVNKYQVISYSATKPINIQVKERILSNYQAGHVYIEILNTSSGNMDFSSLPR